MRAATATLYPCAVTEGSLVAPCHSRPEIMADFLEKYRDCGVKITLSHETEPLGTAGPIALAKEHLDDGEPFFVLNCDIACEFSLRSLLDFHNAVRRHPPHCITAALAPSLPCTHAR